MNDVVYPMSALVDLDDLVLALVLGAIDPRIGGVLLRGDKGSAKTTAARALASLLPNGAPFVEIPLGASEDRVVGSIDVAAILGQGEHRFAPGLLHEADGGVLYVDEVNLLADHLVDLILDAAATGVNRVEREGISHQHRARFVLVGSMNPEEGELRPQLLDRFGLSVQVSAPSDLAQRAEAVRRRLAFDADPEAFVGQWAGPEAELAARVRAATPVPLAEGVSEAVARLCVAAGAEGLRADLVICRAAAALGAWRGQAEAGAEEVATVAPLALAHRRRSPFQTSALDAGELEELVEQTLSGLALPEGHGPGSPPAEPGDTEDLRGSCSEEPSSSPKRPEEPDGSPEFAAAWQVLEQRRLKGAGSSGRRRSPSSGSEDRGKVVGTDEWAPGGAGALAPRATVLAAAVRSSTERPIRVQAEDLRTARRQSNGAAVIVFALDVSGSMGVAERVAAARGAVLALVADAYQRRDRVAVITYRDRSAEVILRPTSSTEVALARLTDVATGGRTPLAAGIDAAAQLALEERRKGAEPLVVVVTDGRATWAEQGQDPLEAAFDAARSCRTSALATLVVDCETNARPLGVAKALAEEMGARYVSMGSLDAGMSSGARLAEVVSDSLA